VNRGVEEESLNRIAANAQRWQGRKDLSHLAGRTSQIAAIVLLLVRPSLTPLIAADQPGDFPKLPIERLDPPEKDFFSKMIRFRGIPIKAHEVVVDEALYAARERLAMELQNQPMVISNLVAAGVELHIIGRNQVTTDLPEWRRDKGKPIYEPTYNGMTRDERTRGMGGRLTSCGEENLLRLEKDRYHGRDICLHEFAHAIRNFGLPGEVRTRFDAQYHDSLAKGLWKGSYAGSNRDEFFAELTMWYFGTHGDLHMEGPKPENGPAGLRAYDPGAYALFDAFYSGRMTVGTVKPRGDPP
jgi:alpha-glucosidase